MKFNQNVNLLHITRIGITILRMSSRLEQVKYSPDENFIEADLVRLQTKDWKKELVSVKFTGDVDRGAELMTFFVKGVRDVLRALQKRNMIGEGYTVPNTRLVYPENKKDLFSARCLTEIATRQYLNQEICLVLLTLQINPDYIARLSRFDPEKIYKLTKMTSENTTMIVQEGRATDIIYVDGVEEAAHSVYVWNHIPTGASFSNKPDDTNVARFDASPVEFHGLGWRIREVTDSEDIPEDRKEIVLGPLCTRLQNAIAYRQSQKNIRGST